MSVAKVNKDNIKSEPVAYSDAALRNNAVVVEYCRTSMAALSGSTAGNIFLIIHLVKHLLSTNCISLQ